MAILRTIHQFIQACSHHVDIFDAKESKLNVVIEILVLIAFSRCSVSHRIYLIENYFVC